MTATSKSIYSRDRNIWHLSHEGGGLEDPWHEPERGHVSSSPTASKRRRTSRSTWRSTSSRASPRRVNGVAMGPIDLVTTLNKLGGKHGVGPDRPGRKPAGRHEVARGLRDARRHDHLSRARCAGADLPGQAEPAVQAGGRAQVRRAGLQRPVVHPAARGAGRLRRRHAEARHRHRATQAHKGNITIVGRKSPFSLYREDYATFGEEDVYNQKDAEGFIKLFGLPDEGRAPCWTSKAPAAASTPGRTTRRSSGTE